MNERAKEIVREVEAAANAKKLTRERWEAAWNALRALPLGAIERPRMLEALLVYRP